MGRTIRCPYCYWLAPSRSLLDRMRSVLGGKARCMHCGRPFACRLGQQAAWSYNHILRRFEERLGSEMKQLPVAERAGTLVHLGLRMEDVKVAGVDLLLRSLAEQLHGYVAGLSRGYEGHLNIRRVRRGNAACLEVDAMINDGSLHRRRIRIARVEPSGFIEVDMARLSESPHNHRPHNLASSVG